MKYLSHSFLLGGILPDEWHSFINYFNHQAKMYAEEAFIRYYTEENRVPRYLSLTYKQVDRMTTNLACEWHQEIKGKKPVAVLFDHSSDLLLSMLAVFKLRVPLLVLSPRNSKAAISNLLQTTESGVLISGEKYKQIAQDAVNNTKECKLLSMSAFDLNCLARQPLHDLASSILDTDFDKNDLDEICLILHSSGTTGYPKPVYQTNRSFLNKFHLPQEMMESGKPIGSGSDIYYAGMPIFHSFGLASFFSVLYNGSSAVFPKRLPPSQQDIEFALNENKCNIMGTPPIVVGEMADFSKNRDTSHIDRLRCIMTGGAQIKKEDGNWFHAKGVRLCLCYGLTEATGMMTNDWDTTKDYTGETSPFTVNANGDLYCHMEALDPRDTSIKHLCIKGDLPSLCKVKLRQDGFFETGDLFKESSENPGYYQYLGRKDDTIVLSNGEKTNPAPIEQILNTSPMIKQSIVFGHGRQCISVLILANQDVTKNMSERDIMVNMEDVIKKVNEVSPSHSAIVPQMVKLLPINTLLPMTPKGTIMRNRVEDMFNATLDKLYTDFLGGVERPAKRQKTTDPNKQDIIQFLLQGVSKVLSLSVGQIEIERSLFDLGLDSLKSIQLRNYISTRFNVDNSFIFHYSSISSMYSGLLAKNKNLTEKSYNDTQDISKRYLQRAEEDFGTNIIPEGTSRKPKVVLLTGVTGSLGAFILYELLKDSTVKKVYCVIRGDPTKIWLRLEKSLRDRLLDISILSNKERIEAISLDFMDTTFGLDRARFIKMKEEVNMVQHCGWLLDFNMPIEHFDKECIAPFYQLLKFSLQRKNPIPVHFVSSVSASARLDTTHIQEEGFPLDSRIALPMGYAQSKFVAELIVDLLATKKKLPCYIHRVGQMHGDTANGIWNYSEQFPLMFIGGGALMGVMPDMDRVINWLPIDYAAKVIVEIMSETYARTTSQHIYHIVNPDYLQWTDILNILKSSGNDFTTVSLSEWVHMLSNSPKNPAIALLSHYEAMLKNNNSQVPIWETEKTRSIAPTMNHIPRLDCNLFKKFLVHWKPVISQHT